MKSIFYTSIIISLLFALSCTNSETPSHLPQPTDISEHQDESGMKDIRKAWFEDIHRAPEGVDWREIEYKNQLKKHKAKLALLETRSGNCDEVESYANDKIQAKWIEKGSINQAGSVHDTDYDPVEDMIYVVSDGGTLFKGPRTGNEWEVINQDFQFSRGLLKLLRPEENQKRILSCINGNPHYSDDDGISWVKSDGIDNSSGGLQDDVFTFEKDSTTYLIMLNKRGAGQNMDLVYSTDFGASFQVAKEFNTGDINRLSANKPYNSDELYIIERKGGTFSHMYQWNFDNMDVDTLSTYSNLDFSLRSDLDGILYNDTITRFYAYNSANVIYMTEDFGNTWIEKGSFPENPWAVGLHVSAKAPDIIYMGEVNCHRSTDGGATWVAVNEWWQYYDNVEFALHADIMYFENFLSNEGEYFTLISNHGGLSISYDELVTKRNLALEGLNVSQYYSVRTSPDLPELVFAGAQDQGFQRGFSFSEEEQLYLEQYISGDYGHIVFTNDGRNMWTTYPFGSISVNLNAQNGSFTAGYTIESFNEAPWLQYLVADPDQSKNRIYAAGGSAEGGSGSYMIQLDYEPSGIVATNLPFNFMAASGSLVTALGISTLEDRTFYGVTENGRFYYSEDDGQNWETGSTILNAGSWLYGQALMVSKVHEGTVWVAGAGYGGDAVFKSEDKGLTFEPMTEGLPETLVYDLAANDDESLLFAATENGPYVYVVQDEQWYDISQLCAPANVYWSVEYVSALGIARFGTYGRGIFDFAIKEFVDVENEVAANNDITIYPNPVDDVIYFKNVDNIKGLHNLSIQNMQGQTVLRKNNVDRMDLEGGIYLGDLTKGQYVVYLSDGKESKTLLMVVL